MLSDQGFLYDPDSERGHSLNPNLVAFSQLASKPCLALLGEPGIGKTWALNAEKAMVKESIARDGGDMLWLDLKSFGSEDRLWRRVFEGEEFNKWRKADYILHVFLDSLDECLLRISGSERESGKTCILRGFLRDAYLARDN
jgi:predicted NACHT family NTPase